MLQAGDHIRLHDLVPAIVDRLPAILADVRELLVEQQPDYARFLAEEFNAVVAAAEGFIARLIGLVEQDPMSLELEFKIEQALFEEIGRLHCQQQQDVTHLLAAYRTGATVTWRHLTDAALQLGVRAEAFAGLAAAVFAAVDQLSAASFRGYVRAQTGCTHQQHRDELADLLLSDRCDTAAVQAAAARAEWPLPRQAAVVLITPADEAGPAPLDRLDESCLRLRRRHMLVGIVPDPDGPGQRKRLTTALRGATAVVGATVSLDRLPASVGLAELAVRLQQAQVLLDDPLFVDEHLDSMVVHQDERLLAARRQQCLAPLAALAPPARDRLVETLRSWLMNMGNRKAVADVLHVHPQTVRYRLGRLRHLFGAALDDPATCAALLLALAWGPAATECNLPVPRIGMD